jgi:hypothetical protein
MILMKVIHKMKNMMNQEFQQLRESQLIELMNFQMQIIQFVSIVNLIQMKWREIDGNYGNSHISELKLSQEFKHEQRFHRETPLTFPSVVRLNHPAQQFYAEKIHSFDFLFVCFDWSKNFIQTQFDKRAQSKRRIFVREIV